MFLTLECGYIFKTCAVGAYSCFTRCTTYQVWSPLSMSAIDIHFPMYATRIMCLILWWALAYLSLSTLMHVVFIDMKPRWCAVMHQMWKSAWFSHWKCGIFLPYSLHKSLGENNVLGEMLLNFRHENKVKYCQIFTMEIW